MQMLGLLSAYFWAGITSLTLTGKVAHATKNYDNNK